MLVKPGYLNSNFTLTLAKVSSLNECHSSRARKTEHMRSRQNVPAGQRWRPNRSIAWHTERLLLHVRYTNSKHSPSSNAIFKLYVWCLTFASPFSTAYSLPLGYPLDQLLRYSCHLPFNLCLPIYCSVCYTWDNEYWQNYNDREHNLTRLHWHKLHAFLFHNTHRESIPTIVQLVFCQMIHSFFGFD